MKPFRYRSPAFSFFYSVMILPQWNTGRNTVATAPQIFLHFVTPPSSTIIPRSFRHFWKLCTEKLVMWWNPSWRSGKNKKNASLSVMMLWSIADAVLVAVHIDTQIKRLILTSRHPLSFTNPPTTPYFKLIFPNRVIWTRHNNKVFLFKEKGLL